MNGEQRRRSSTFGEDFADAMSRRFGRNHRDVDVLRRGDRSVANVEAVSEHKHFARGKIGRDFFFIYSGLRGIRREQHYDVGPCGSIAIGFDRKARADRLLSRLTLIVEPYANCATAIPEIQGMRMPLRTISDNGDLLGLNQREVWGIAMINRSHSVS